MYDGGVDGFMIETQIATEETLLALRVAKENFDVLNIVSLVYDKGPRFRNRFKNPIDPVIIAPISVRISPKRLLATTTSKFCGFLIKSIQAASINNESVVTWG